MNSCFRVSTGGRQCLAKQGSPCAASKWTVNALPFRNRLHPRPAGCANGLVQDEAQNDNDNAASDFHLYIIAPGRPSVCLCFPYRRGSYGKSGGKTGRDMRMK